MNQEIVVISGNEQLELKEAERIDGELVNMVSGVRERLFIMDTMGGWATLGFHSLEAYLVDLGERTGFGSKYLRRINNTAQLEDGTGYEIGTFKEGTVRPINETLSDVKGFNSAQRGDALELAIEMAGDLDAVTGSIAQSAAWYIAVEDQTPAPAERLPERMRDGELSPRKAYEICQLLRGTSALGIEHILAEVSDPHLAESMVNLYKNAPTGERWLDLRETIERTHSMPTAFGSQVDIADATNSDLVGFLNEPARLVRQEKGAEHTDSLRQIAQASARLMVQYYGTSTNGLPEALQLGDDLFETEIELYRLLQNGGHIR